MKKRSYISLIAASVFAFGVANVAVASDSDEKSDAAQDTSVGVAGMHVGLDKSGNTRALTANEMKELQAAALKLTKQNRQARQAKAAPAGASAKASGYDINAVGQEFWMSTVVHIGENGEITTHCEHGPGDKIHEGHVHTKPATK